MPRVNMFRDKHEHLAELLNGKKSRSGKTNEEFARILGMSRQTLFNRIKRPGTFTIDEIEKFGRALNVPIDELRLEIKY